MGDNDAPVTSSLTRKAIQPVEQRLSTQSKLFDWADIIRQLKIPKMRITSSFGK